LKFAFYLLYHQLAWTYDSVAKIVSVGNWNTWVQTVIPYISDDPVLELGHGPGHLQNALVEHGYRSYGLDASPYMSRMAQKRLRHLGIMSKLILGRSEALPFADHTFPTVVATFPSEFIMQPQTLREVWRILSPDGQLLILPVTWITGKSWLERLAAWLFRITGQSSPQAWKITDDKYYTKITYISDIGYTYAQQLIDLPSSTVFLLVLTKPGKS
jgi:ubiquinone/menaquinone biosynthesis C-methylase UbiE